MPKTLVQFLCSECGDTFPKWLGKCPSCGGWNTIKEFRESKIASTSGTKISGGKNLAKADLDSGGLDIGNVSRFSTGILEVDRVIGDGFFPGSLVLFGGAPGIGKSTLALQIFLKLENSLYFSGEESLEQVFSRVERIGAGKTNLENRIFSTNLLEDICTTIEQARPPLAVVDSIQMVGTETSSLGQLSRLRENTEILLRLAKTTGTTILMIGHITKSDELAGPKILEHIVDTVLRLEGDRGSEVRILRSSKNRFGSTTEIGVFEMRGDGLVELKNPSEFFLAERAENAFGSAISVVREGARNFLLEIQVLTVKTNFGQPRRTSSGIDPSKFHLLLAVISKFTPFQCDSFDAYTSVVGGLRVREPAADLAICAAILSSRAEKEIPADTVILGEVGLSGEIRSVSNLGLRLHEAEKLGFRHAIVPRIREKMKMPKNLKIVEVRSIGELMKEILKKRY